VAKNSFRCKLVTPTAALVDDQCTYASVPAHDGLFGVMPGRAPILAKLGVGELRLEMADDAKTGKGGSRSFLVGGGFVKMAGDELTILAESAWSAEGISASDAEAELRKLEGVKPADETARAAHTRDLELARRRVAMARHGRGI